MKLIRLLVIISVLVSTAAGCATQQIPGVRIEPVTQFSLGSAKFKPFKKRPTAEELRAAALRLYDSFDTAAATAKMTNSTSVIDFRAVKPDKELTTGGWISVRNGKTGFWYVPSNRIYVPCPPPSIERHMPVGRWIGLTRERPFSGMRLLSDQNLNGTEVYVLEMRMSEKRDKHGVSPAERVRIFLGKNDLLPRRVETVGERSGEESSVQGLPDYSSRQDFLGFVANSKLPDELFPTKPPKGAKRATGNTVTLD